MSDLENLLREYQELPEFAGTSLQSVNQRGGFDSTPLHIAIYRERPKEVGTLLEAGADVNAPGEYGERPLQAAVNCKNTEIIERLLRAGAQPDLKDQEGADTWQVAEALGFRRTLEDIIARACPS